MRMTQIEILHDCGDWPAGECVRVDEKRALRLIRTGYARLVETATVTAAETATEPRPKNRMKQAPEVRG